MTTTTFDFRNMTVTFSDGRTKEFRNHRSYEESPSYMLAAFFNYPPAKRRVIA